MHVTATLDPKCFIAKNWRARAQRVGHILHTRFALEGGTYVAHEIPEGMMDQVMAHPHVTVAMNGAKPPALPQEPAPLGESSAEGEAEATGSLDETEGCETKATEDTGSESESSAEGEAEADPLSELDSLLATTARGSKARPRRIK